jgi:hypothetical protein
VPFMRFACIHVGQEIAFGASWTRVVAVVQESALVRVGLKLGRGLVSWFTYPADRRVQVRERRKRCNVVRGLAA